MDWIEAEILDKYSSVYFIIDELRELAPEARRKIRTIPDKIDILAVK